MVAKLICLILTLCSANKLWADEQELCPCVPAYLCPGGLEMEECCDLHGLVHCCGKPKEFDHEDLYKVIAEDLKEERQIMVFIDRMADVDMPNTENKIRVDKSYSKQNKTKDNSENNEKELNGSLENSSLQQEATNVFIVYAENPNKNNAAFNKDKIPPHIVLPTKDNSSDNPTEYEGNETDIIEPLLGINTEQQNSDITKQKPLQNVYTIKRNSNVEDSEVASSELYEIQEDKEGKDKIPTTYTTSSSSPIHIPNLSTEQIKLPFKSPPRRLLPQPLIVKTEDHRQTGRNVLDFLREQPKGRMGLKPIRIFEEMVQNTDISPTINPEKAAIMAHLNIKAINSIMKTNFSSHRMYLTPNQHTSTELKHSMRDSVLLDNNPHKKQVTNDGPSTAIEMGGNKTQRGRIRSRIQSIKHTTTETTMPQEDDRNDDTRLQESSKRFQSYKRLRAQVHNQGVGSETTIKINETEHNIINKTSHNQLKDSAKILPAINIRPFRPRMKVYTSTTTTPTTVSPTKETRLTHKTPIRITTQTPTPETGFTDSKFRDETHNKPLSSESDLESSGSDYDPQQLSVNGAFLPPNMMESGFEPMLSGHNLHTIGHIPKDLSRLGFDRTGDVIGLELPLTESQIPFGGRRRTLPKIPEQLLLPPIFPAPQAPTFQSDFTEGDVPGLLPPVELPSPTNTELNKPKDFTQLNLEIDSLKNRYETLLEKYVKALNNYNDKFKQFFS